MIRRIQVVIRNIEEKEAESARVGLIDVEALYPSIHQKKGTKIVAQEEMMSGIRYKRLS